MFPRWIVHLLLVVLLGLSAGCSRDQEDVSKGKEAKSFVNLRKTNGSVQDPTILRGVLPEATIAYLRIPHILGFISSPKGDLFTGAFANKQHAELVRELHKTLYASVLSPENISASPWHAFILHHMRSPLEIAVIPAERNPYPLFLLATRLNAKSMQEVNGLLKKLSASDPRLMLMQEMNNAGYAALSMGPLTVQLHYDVSSKALRMLAGLAVRPVQFKKVLSGLTKVTAHPANELEIEIDESRHGLFAWVQVERLLKMLSSTLPPDRVQILSAKLHGYRAIAFGWGVSKGRGKIKILAQTKGLELLQVLPSPASDLRFKTSGIPKVLMNLSLPTQTHLKELEAMLDRNVQDKALRAYRKFRNGFFRTTGFSLDTMVNAFGPGVLFLEDSVGEFIALEVRSEKSYQQALKALTEKQLLTAVGKIKGHDIYHLTLPSIWKPGKNTRGKRVPVIVEWLLRSKTHLYWYREKDHVVMSAIPQLLQDRIQYSPKLHLGQWMKERQGHDLSSAIVSVTSTIPDSPRKLYYMYLQLLVFLGDVADVNLDISKLPSAVDLRLPGEGVYGLQLIATRSRLGAELTFENNPMEIFIGQNLNGVAVLGVLAAIAIPAYQDYILRAQIMEAYYSVNPARQAITKYWQSKGKFPDATDARLIESMVHPEKYKQIRTVEVLSGDGRIVITLQGRVKIAGKKIVLEPKVIKPGSIRWTCRSNVQRKYLPAICRW